MASVDSIVCPKCQRKHALTGRQPGEPFTCPCGHVMVLAGTPMVETPSTPSGRTRPAWLAPALVLGSAAVILSLGAALVGLISFPGFLGGARLGDPSGEARANLYTLCTEVATLHGESGEWVRAGPQPPEVPRGVKVPFPIDARFERIGFAPAKVRYQYEVVVDPAGPSVRCVARGDLDGDGQTSEATVVLDAQGKPGPVIWTGARE